MIFGRRQRKRRKKDCLPEKTGRARGLNAYEACYSSQNGEDGIIAEIFRRVGATNKFSAEIGVEDGRECNTAELLRHAGWSGLMIEGDPVKYAGLQRRFRRFRRVTTINAFVTAENVVDIFQKAVVPSQLDLLSVDVDGNDWWILQQLLSAYQPRVVIAEINPFYPPPARWVMPYDPNHRWDDTTYFGASLSAMTDLLDRFGYALVAVECNVVNAFFVRREELEKLGFPEAEPEEVYHFTPSFPGRRFGYAGNVP